MSLRKTSRNAPQSSKAGAPTWMDSHPRSRNHACRPSCPRPGIRKSKVMGCRSDSHCNHRQRIFCRRCGRKSATSLALCLGGYVSIPSEIRTYSTGLTRAERTRLMMAGFANPKPANSQQVPTRRPTKRAPIAARGTSVFLAGDERASTLNSLYSTALVMSSTTFLASPKTIMVLSI